MERPSARVVGDLATEFDHLHRDYSRLDAEFEAYKAERPKHLTYLACPYSHPDPAVREQRWQAVNVAAGNLMRAGLMVFSPISHTHAIAVVGDLPTGWDYWAAFDRAYLEACNKIIVLKLPGWEESQGVAGEIAIALELGIPVEYLDPAP